MSARKSPSKLDAEDDQDISVFNELAVVTVWHNEFNNEDEETINEGEDNTEDFAEETANGSNDTTESDIKESDDGENKPDYFDDKDEEFSNNSSEFLKSATENNFRLNDQLQVGKETLEELNDFPKEGGNETTVNSFGTTFNFGSSSNFNDDDSNIIMAFLDNFTARWAASG